MIHHKLSTSTHVNAAVQVVVEVKAAQVHKFITAKPVHVYVLIAKECQLVDVEEEKGRN